MFQKSDNGLNSLVPRFLNDYINFYELTTVMCQNDHLFINILKRSRKKTHNIKNIDLINLLYFKQFPNDSIILHVYYMNKDTMAHNIFLNNI